MSSFKTLVTNIKVVGRIISFINGCFEYYEKFWLRVVNCTVNIGANAKSSESDRFKLLPLKSGNKL